jgi:hypothetical protein
MSFRTSIYISVDDLDAGSECLRSILESSEVELFLEIDFDYSGGYDGDYENPPESAEANWTSICIEGMKFSGDVIQENVEVLMLEEHKLAFQHLAESIINRGWSKRYEQEAFDSIPGPDDYY